MVRVKFVTLHPQTRFEEMNKFKEVSESYTMAEAIQEAQRCLRCKVPSCKKGCPISNDIPDWIHELRKGNMGNAIQIIRAKSNLPSVCGRVCAHERQCQGSCVLGKQGKNINIGKLERFIADFDAELNLTHSDIPAKTRGRVAVIGSGPAGLTVSGDLARMGFHVDIFEMEREAGGVLMYGIPEYRLPKEVVRREVRLIEELGVVFHMNTTVGEDITIDQMFEQGFDAVFVGTGTSKPRELDIPGKETKGAVMATHFLRISQLYQDGLAGRNEVAVKPGDKVYVIGCGNTAMDAARMAIRLGARTVDVVYHRTIDRMAALHSEYEEALEEGIRFNWNADIVEIHHDDNGSMTEIVMQTKRPAPTPEDPDHMEYERKTLGADVVLLAVGAQPATTASRNTSGINTDEKGFMLTREMPYGMTSRRGVFAGGDVANRQASVVHAMRDAKLVAEGIAQYVDAVKLMESIDLK